MRLQGLSLKTRFLEELFEGACHRRHLGGRNTSFRRAFACTLLSDIRGISGPEGPSGLWLANASALYRGQNPQKREKRVSGSKNSRFPRPQKRGDLSRKIPISLQGSTRKMGIFRLKSPFSGALGNGSFLTPKPSFPAFGDFDPCTGPTRSQPVARKGQALFAVKVKRGRQKGDGKKNVRNCHDKSVPFTSNPILSEAPPSPSHECLLMYRK